MKSGDVLEILRFLFEFAIALIIKSNINGLRNFIIKLEHKRRYH